MNFRNPLRGTLLICSLLFAGGAAPSSGEGVAAASQPSKDEASFLAYIKVVGKDGMTARRADSGDIVRVFFNKRTDIRKDTFSPGTQTDLVQGDYALISGKLQGKVFLAGQIVTDAEKSAAFRQRLGNRIVVGKTLNTSGGLVKVLRVDGVVQTIRLEQTCHFVRQKGMPGPASVRVGEQIAAKGNLVDGIFWTSSLEILRDQSSVLGS